MSELSENGLTPDSWGGDTLFVNISAKTGLGIPELLDNLFLYLLYISMQLYRYLLLLVHQSLFPLVIVLLRFRLYLFALLLIL